MYLQEISKHLPVVYKAYVESRARYERRIDRDFDSGTPDNRSDIILRFRPGIEFSLGKKWSGELQYQYVNDSIHTPSGHSSDDMSDLNLAYVRYKEGKSEVTIGRQKINIGSERLLGTLEWSPAGRSFDGIRARIENWDAFAFKVGVAFPKPRNLRMAGLTHKGRYGLSQLYFKHDAPNGAPDIDIWTLAHAYERKWDKWTFETEDALQFGHASGKSLRAWAVHVGLTYTLDPKTKITIDANAASGGSNSSTVFTFDNLLPTNHKFYGSMDLQSWRNMEELALALEHKFDPKWTGKLSWRTLALRDPSDAWYGASGAVNRGSLGPFVDPTGSSGRDLGREINLEFSYRHSATISASAGIGLFLPGSFVRNLNGGVADRQIWGYVMVQVRF